MKKLWQKDTVAADWVIRFTVGEDLRWDTLLLPYDVAGTRAHAWALSEMGILKPAEFEAIGEALDALLVAYEAGEVEVTTADEDCHTVIEHHLASHLGDVGQKIHAGRSRNDQVLVALRLFLRDAIADIADQVRQLGEALCDLGERYQGALMPGYTHMQPAMPTTAGLWAMGYAELLVSDLAHLRTASDQINVSPWGSAAGYAVPYLDMPRDAVAERLGFRGVQRHVTAVQLSRGKLELGVVHALIQVAGTINRMASDLVLYNTAAYGFVTLPVAFCTGSSIMPQKRNPDVLELARAYYHRLLAECNLLLTLPANMSSGYHRDLQLTKEAVMRSVLLGQDLLSAASEVVPGVTFDVAGMAAACPPALFATAHALEQVEQGIPFRQAYRETGKQLDALKRPAVDEALKAYKIAGGPRHIRPDEVRAALHQGGF